MDDIVWEDPPANASGKPPKYATFFGELRANPGKWARWPGNPQTISAASSLATLVRQGKYATTKPGEFEAVTRGGVLYVRYVGDATPVRSVS